MIDEEIRDKVIKAFEFCLMPPSREELENDICSHEDCPYYREYNGGKCISAAASDALALLKAQEPVTPVPDTSYGARPWWFVCGNCKLSVNEDQKYCPNCGRAVKWE